MSWSERSWAVPVEADGVLCALILVSGFDLLLWAGAALVWIATNGMRASTPCRLGVALVVGTHFAANMSYLGGGAKPQLSWAWLVQTALYFMLLYLLYHMAVLLSFCRK